MVDEIKANAVINSIVAQFAPDKIILFGSHASGNAGAQSDYDLCILKKGIVSKRKYAQDIYKMLTITDIPIDIIADTPEHFDKYESNPDFIYFDINARGKILYDRTN